MQHIKPIISWLSALWISRIFLTSLTYKFTGAPETIHIFSTIGQWMSNTIAEPVGTLFANYGAYLTGTGELITSIILLAPALLWLLHKAKLTPNANRSSLHSLGGILSTIIMLGAIFFHLFTPLGIEVLHEGQSDGGSLFYAAVTIAILGLILFNINGRTITPKFEK